MLHAYPWMADINVDHWRNLQSLILESAKEKRRIVLIHEDGEILKFVHTQRAEIVRNVDRVDNPHQVAEKVYHANAGKADFVAVFERRAFDRYFAQFQDTWKADEDLDEFVHRTYALMDEYPDGIVTYPGPARTMLGLQWRVGASYEDVQAAVHRFVPADSTVIFGIFEGDVLWATLVLGFDADKRARVVTTADPTEIPSGGWQTTAKELVKWVNRKYPPCSLGMFMDLNGARAMLANKDKLAALSDIAAKGKLLVDPVPESLAKLLGRS
jgi:hypothetical protein